MESAENPPPPPATHPPPQSPSLPPPVPPPADPEYVYHPKTHRKIKRGTPKYNELRDAFGFTCLQQWHQDYVEAKIWGKPAPPIEPPNRPDGPRKRSVVMETIHEKNGTEPVDDPDGPLSDGESESSSSSQKDNRVELDDLEEGEIRDGMVEAEEEKVDPYPPARACPFNFGFPQVPPQQDRSLPPILPGPPHRQDYGFPQQPVEPSYYYRYPPSQLPPQYQPRPGPVRNSHFVQPARMGYDFRTIFA